jgi:hypothetical protein
MMKTFWFRKILLACFPAAVISLPVSGQDIRFTADTRITSEASSQEIMKSDVFAYTALAASGAADAEIPGLLAQLDRAYGQIADSISSETTDSGKAEQTLYQLYAVVLSQYSETQTLVTTALTSGVYNCVSSDILFMYMMKREGIPVVAVETPLHAFCIVQVDGRFVDVETTNPYGFDPGAKKVLSGNSSAQKKYVTVPAKKYAGRHQVDDRRLISLIYNNRMSVLQKQKADYETIGLAVDAMKLQDNSAESFTTLSQAVYNTAVDYSETGKNEDGLALTARAEEIFGEAPLYRVYAAAAVGNILNDGMNRHEYDNAFAVLEKYRPQLNDSDYTEMHDAVLVNSLNYAVSVQPFETAAAAIRNNKSVLSGTNYTKLLSYAYSKAAAATADTGAWLDASALIERGLQELPGSSTLVNQRNVYRRNYAVEIHNKAAALYNAGNKKDALLLIQDGLTRVSDSSILQNDLRRMQGN